MGCVCVVARGGALPLLDKWLNKKCLLIPQNELLDKWLNKKCLLIPQNDRNF